MRNFLLATSLLTGVIAIATPAHADTTWQGVSVAVPNDDTGQSETYSVQFTFNDSAPLFINQLIAQDPAQTPYTRAFYGNITSFSVSGPRQNVAFASGNAFVSTLAPDLARFGSVPFLILAGTDGLTPGYQLQFSYTPPVAYGSTAMPASLDIAGAAYGSFNLQRYDYDGDPADEIIGDPVILLNFFFKSGGFVPSAAAVPEPATWAMMIVGLGLIGGTMRRRRTAIAST